MEIPHIPVLSQEVKDLFSDIKDGYILDCTVGYGGHSEAILEQNPHIKLICVDRDREALDFSEKRLAKFKDRIIFDKDRFSNAVKKFEKYDIKGILADIGVSSLQLDKKDRGFSFVSDSLDMRMDQNSSFSAYDVINGYSKTELEEIFKNYGEIREYKKVADIVVKNRPFYSARELSDTIQRYFKKGKIHAATLIFQAVRIEVNDELGELDRLLENIENSHIDDAIVAIITFHSLEDRIVKRTFKEWSKSCICPPDAYRCECGNNHSLGYIITKKPIKPSKKEIDKNPRSRSAKLRAFKIDRGLNSGES